MKVKYKGVEYDLKFARRVTLGDRLDDRYVNDQFSEAIQKKTGVPIGQQMVSLGTIPVEKVSGALPKNSTFLLRHRSGKQHEFDKRRQVEIVLKDEYDNEEYTYITKGSELSVLQNKDVCSLVAPGFPRGNETAPINENTTFYLVPKDSRALFITTVAPKSPFAEGFKPQTYCVSFNDRTTVSDLKQQIADKTGLNTARLKLWNGDVELSDKTVVSQGLKDGAELGCEFDWETRKSVFKNYNKGYNKNRLGNSINVGILAALGTGACGVIAHLLNARAYIPEKIVPSIKLCIAASIVVGVISGIGKYKYDAPSHSGL